MRLVLIFPVFLLICAGSSTAKDQGKSKSVPDNTPRLIWVQPENIAARDLFYGPGGKDHAPHTTFTFLREDLNGTNPKFDVRDENGTKWRVKLGVEAKPETAASRLLWAVGYFANEDYFLPELRVEDMKPMKRGDNLIAPDGTMHDVRLKRFSKGEKKRGIWRWRTNPFFGTREFNGLRVMMALMNSWDLKDVNNSVYKVAGENGAPELRYVISDLGSTFGTTGLTFPLTKSKGNSVSYSNSRFIKRVHGDLVDFETPSRATFLDAFKPKGFTQRFPMQWIGRDIPRTDARWVGQLLSQLSQEQIRQAFQAAGYSPEDVERFTDVIEKRIKELNNL